MEKNVLLFYLHEEKIRDDGKRKEKNTTQN